MSVILMCRKLVEVNPKQKLLTVINGLKIHTRSSPGILASKNKVPNFLNKRSIVQWFRKPKKADLKIIDNVPDQYELIFRSTLERYILYTQLGTTIATSIVLLVVIILYGSPKGQLTFYGETEHKPTSKEEDVHVYLAIFITVVVLLQFLISKLPLRIYYLSQQKQYILILPSSLPNQTKRLVYKIGEVEKLPMNGMMAWKDSKYLIKKENTVILPEDNFRAPADLYIMLGIQRDPDSED